ncbi:hypothetical protein Tco_0558906 [Tanacetum coccineum]
MSSIAKFDVEKFDGSNDFGLWRVKMRCLLIQHGWEAVLDPFLETMADAEKTAALKTECPKGNVVWFKKAPSKKLSKHVDEFNKLIGDLANIGVDIDDKDQIFGGGFSCTKPQSREVKKRTDAKELMRLGLYVRGRSDHRGNQGRGSSQSKSKGKGTYKLKCYICYSKDYLKKDYPKRNKKKSTGFVKKNAGQGFGVHSEGYDNGDLLMRWVRKVS